MAGKNGQRVQTKRNPTNAKKIGSAQEHWQRVLSKRKSYRLLARQRQKLDTGKQFTNDYSEIKFNWEWLEDMPPPYPSDEVSVDISKEQAIELIKVLTDTFKL